MTTFAGYLIYIKVIDGFGGLGALTREWNNRNPDGYDGYDRRNPDGYDGYDRRNLSFNAFLKLRYPEDWVAYQTYLRLINKE